MEKKLQSVIIKWLKSMGAYVIKVSAIPGVPVGCPDIICLYEDRWCVIEVKADEHAKMQPGQQATLNFLSAQNPYVYKVHPMQNSVRVRTESIFTTSTKGILPNWPKRTPRESK